MVIEEYIAHEAMNCLLIIAFLLAGSKKSLHTAGLLLLHTLLALLQAELALVGLLGVLAELASGTALLAGLAVAGGRIGADLLVDRGVQVLQAISLDAVLQVLSKLSLEALGLLLAELAHELSNVLAEDAVTEALRKKEIKVNTTGMGD